MVVMVEYIKTFKVVVVVQEENQSRWLISILYLMWKENQS